MAKSELAFDQIKCPHCGLIATADFVDIGVGMQQSGPFGCETCGWSESKPDVFQPSDEDEPF
jgi:hypothetical protein